MLTSTVELGIQARQGGIGTRPPVGHGLWLVTGVEISASFTDLRYMVGRGGLARCFNDKWLLNTQGETSGYKSCRVDNLEGIGPCDGEGCLLGVSVRLSSLLSRIVL